MFGTGLCICGAVSRKMEIYELDEIQAKRCRQGRNSRREAINGDTMDGGTKKSH